MFIQEVKKWSDEKLSNYLRNNSPEFGTWADKLLYRLARAEWQKRIAAEQEDEC